MFFFNASQNSPDNSALRELIESGALANISFFGLAQSFISNHDLDLILSRLVKVKGTTKILWLFSACSPFVKQLSGLDLFKCSYLDDAAVHELLKAMPTLALRDLWLPSGGWWPILQDNEEIVIHATNGMSLNNPVFDARGKPFARANQRNGMQVKISAHYCCKSHTNTVAGRHTLSTFWSHKRGCEGCTR